MKVLSAEQILRNIAGSGIPDHGTDERWERAASTMAALEDDELVDGVTVRIVYGLTQRRLMDTLVPKVRAIGNDPHQFLVGDVREALGDIDG